MDPQRNELDSRPLITLVIRHLNQGQFIGAALEAAFAQTYDPLEILLIDDCSTDGGFEIARSMIRRYSGSHRTELARNEKTIGPGAQMMRARELAKGEIIVFADGDDVSLPARCERIYEAFRDGGPDVLGVISYFDLIDANGAPIDVAAVRSAGRTQVEEWTAEQLAHGDAGTTGAVLAVRRRVLEMGHSLDALHRGEDHACGFRCAVLGRLRTVPEVLVLRRIHSSNVSSPMSQSWTAAECVAHFRRDVREAVLVPPLMRRDLAQFVRLGLVTAEAAAPVDRALVQHSRRLKLLHLATRTTSWRACLIACSIWRLGFSLRDSVRMVLPAAAPRLEVLRIRRNTRTR